MAGIYPLKPIITTNKAFADLYDRHPRSIYQISGCLTPAEAESWLRRGAVFETVVLLNGEGEGLVHRLAAGDDPQDQSFCRIERIDLPVIDEEALKQVHRLLRQQGARAFFRPLPVPPLG